MPDQKFISLLEANRMLTEYFRRHDVESPRLCSEIILAKSLDLTRVDIYARHDRPVNEVELQGIRTLGKRVAGGEPLQIVVGDSQFFSYFFKVRKGVFIPRPETETLVLSTANELKKSRTENSITFLDLCCGTGVVGITLLLFIPSATCTAVDISPDAIDLTRENALSLGVSERISVVEGNLFSAIDGNNIFNVIACNPPYIPTCDILGLDPIVKDYDPHAALDGGQDGLDIVRQIADTSPQYLRGDGFLSMEIGIGQSEEVEKIFRRAGFIRTETVKDLSGIDRVVMGWLQ